VYDDGIQIFLKGASHMSSPAVVFMHEEVNLMRIMHASEHLVPHLAHASRVPFGYHNLCL
jgi:hypothetical protein